MECGVEMRQTLLSRAGPRTRLMQLWASVACQDVGRHHHCCSTPMMRHWSVVRLLKSEGTCSNVNA